MAYYAHTHKTKPWQPLACHLIGVAERAEQYAREAIPHHPEFAKQAFAAGLFHDLGKYRPDFQKRLHNSAIKGETTYHKQAGAAKAFETRNGLVALTICGHHGGLPNPADMRDMVRGASGVTALKEIWPKALADCPQLAQGIQGAPNEPDPYQRDLWVRLIFSCLVDADWTDTRRYSKDLPQDEVGPDLDPESKLINVLEHIKQKSEQCQSSKIREIRDSVLQASLEAATLPTGIFTLNVPTGGGKTLASLAFALKHAEQHELRRVIYVAPYLTILEQNAKSWKAALGIDESDLDFVFQHHTLQEPDSKKDKARVPKTEAEETEEQDRIRHAENWMSPVILTSNVQFFESLFSNHPGQCRKLHRIARSVIILDECQSVPLGLKDPTVSMLDGLAKFAGCSIVLTTATQPYWKFSQVHEIAPKSMNLFEGLERASITWPQGEEKWSWSQLADTMAKEKSALAIVNTKAAAKAVYQELQNRQCQKIVHLSTAMCPSHREQAVKDVRSLLQQGHPVHVVSTQLIEAGVDIDFPTVFRELAPLEGIIQAAGRCNREGLLKGSNGKPGGKTIVFRSEEEKLPNDQWYKAGTATLQTMLRSGVEPNLADDQIIQEYFQRLDHLGNTDALDIQSLRRDSLFRDIAQGSDNPPGKGRYRLIDEATISVVVTTWKEKGKKIAELLQELSNKPTRAAYRSLIPYQVNLYSRQFEENRTLISEHPSGIRLWHGCYDSVAGLVFHDLDLVV